VGNVPEEIREAVFLPVGSIIGHIRILSMRQSTTPPSDKACFGFTGGLEENVDRQALDA
jgi:hypothetical protein